MRFFGILHIRLHRAKHIKFVQAGAVSEKGCAGCMQCLGTTATCNYCSCGQADMCCGKADPFVVIELEQANGKMTRLAVSNTINNSHNPRWKFDHPCLVDCDFEESTSPILYFRMHDDDFGGEKASDQMGVASMKLAEIFKKREVHKKWIEMVRSDKNSHYVGDLCISLTYIPFGDNDSPDVPACYFRAKEGCQMKLYQDAHVTDNIPHVPCENGIFRPEGTWASLYKSINLAKHFVFIVGWSVNVKISLKRSFRPGESHETVGELLKRKAEEGVSVCLLLWDDLTSSKNLQVGVFKAGVMGTCDEETRLYFKGTNVNIQLCPRNAIENGLLSGLFNNAIFTHHQKAVCLDAPCKAGPTPRLLQVYFGGLDITSGRFDCDRHDLFGSLTNAHANDFYNGCLPQSDVANGPREPWHDIHGRVEGPAAWDILQNFTERVLCQAHKFKHHTAKLIKHLLADGELAGPNFKLTHHDNWTVQIFRSIDSSSAEFQNPKFLTWFERDKLAMDRSIQQAYLYQINRAKRFIYFENQYFLGSSQFWLDPQQARDVPCQQLIPYCITRKICDKIKRHQEFAVYVLIPLWPEGVPEDGTVQEILHFQYLTIQYMYKTIGQAIANADSNKHPRDYLNFFFVGNRELPHTGGGTTAENDKLNRALANRRHQIYVHSKMFIVDDEYILMGSANINQRSMDGQRDTEIAGGSYQPKYRAKMHGHGNVVLPRGDVFGFRNTLWAEHLGHILPEFSDPGATNNVKTIRNLTDENWKAFSSNDVQKLPYGHMCSYPYLIEQDGSVNSLPDYPNFPDTDAKVIGALSNMLFDILTT